MHIKYQQFPISSIIRAWISDYLKSNHSNGFHFVSDQPIPVKSIPYIVSDIGYAKSENDKMLKRLSTSISDYISKSRALWYFFIPENTFINTLTLEKLFIEYLNKGDPSKQIILEQICIDTVNCAYIFSRAAARSFYELKDDQEVLTGFLSRNLKPITTSNIIVGSISPTSYAFFEKSSYEGIQPCTTPHSYRTMDMYMWLLPFTGDHLGLIRLKLVKDAEKLHYWEKTNNTISLCTKNE